MPCSSRLHCMSSIVNGGVRKGEPSTGEIGLQSQLSFLTHNWVLHCRRWVDAHSLPPSFACRITLGFFSSQPPPQLIEHSLQSSGKRKVQSRGAHARILHSCFSTNLHNNELVCEYLIASRLRWPPPHWTEHISHSLHSATVQGEVTNL